jgi:UDP-N-acetylglucosamine 2-epimerase (non-hydrolysing)
MKAAAVVSAIAQQPQHFQQSLVHTGQHYDVLVSDIFFSELALPNPDVNLCVGSGSQAVQTALIMERFESVVLRYSPDLTLVYGDVNSTLAAALVCSKLQIPVGHVEAGLRSFDRTMPEEINRLLTDQISDLLFVPSIDGKDNLLKEGVAEEKIKVVGNVMIDTLVRLLPEAINRWDAGKINVNGLRPGQDYALMTLHRPSNVDDLDAFKEIMDAVSDVSRHLPVIFPVHPRTMKRLKSIHYREDNRQHLYLINPIGYLDFLALQRNARIVITDSGGIQEETTFLGIPCLTLRENTERPITVAIGTNILIGRDLPRLQTEIELILNGQGKRGQVPPLWDGKASHRIVQVLMNQATD